MPRPRPARACAACHGWGEFPGRVGLCKSCRSWRKTHPKLARCVRCRHLNNVNVDDGLCRLCLITIRLTDPAWAAQRRPAANQLMLLLDGVRFPHPQPIVKNGRRVPGTIRPKRRPRGTPAPNPLDDPRVCPSALIGQQSLFSAAGRRLDQEMAQRIAGRTPRGFPQARAAADRLVRERGVSPSGRGLWLAMARLALAARDADGEQLVTGTTH